MSDNFNFGSIYNFRRVTKKLHLYRHAALDHTSDQDLQRFYDNTGVTYRVDLRSPIEVLRSEMRGAPNVTRLSALKTPSANRKTLMAKRILAKSETDEAKMTLSAAIATRLRPTDIFRSKRNLKEKTEQLVSHKTLMSARKKLELFNVNFISMKYVDNAVWDRCTFGEKWKMVSYMMTFRFTKLIEFVSGKLAWKGLVGTYYDFTDFSGEALFDALKVITEGLEQGHGVSLNCQWGKDRSGICSAMVKYVIGDPLEEIFDDYARSEEEYERMNFMEHMKEEFTRQGLPVEFAGTPKQAMVDLFIYLQDKHGGTIEGYLDHIGFDESWRARLRKMSAE